MDETGQRSAGIQPREPSVQREEQTENSGFGSSRPDKEKNNSSLVPSWHFLKLPYE